MRSGGGLILVLAGLALGFKGLWGLYKFKK